MQRVAATPFVIATLCCALLHGQTADRIAPNTDAAQAGQEQDTRVALKDAPLPSQAREDIVKNLVDVYKNDGDGPGDPTPRESALTDWVEFQPLSRNQKDIVVVTGGPEDPIRGATGDGPIWVFRISDNHATMLLSAADGAGGSMYGAKGKHYHYGLRDFWTYWNVSAADGSSKVYRFDGVRYKPAYCYDSTTDGQGKTHNGRRGACAK